MPSTFQGGTAHSSSTSDGGGLSKSVLLDRRLGFHTFDTGRQDQTTEARHPMEEECYLSGYLGAGLLTCVGPKVPSIFILGPPWNLAGHESWLEAPEISSRWIEH